MGVNQQFFRYLDTNGDGTGTKAATGDYSGVGLGETDFYFQPPSGDIARVARMIVFIADTSVGADDYGAIAGGLTTGIKLQVQKIADDSVVIDITDGLLVKKNSEWGRLCYDSEPNEFAAGNEFWRVRFTFNKTGDPLRLEADEKLVVTLNDDLTGLLDHTFMIQGVWETLSQ